jgi:hypothetical protein
MVSPPIGIKVSAVLFHEAKIHHLPTLPAEIMTGKMEHRFAGRIKRRFSCFSATGV